MNRTSPKASTTNPEGGAGEPGVSVVIVCHNGAARLPATLLHLARQEPAGTPWEVVVVDNASSDSTAKVAVECWPDGACAELRVVREPRLGVYFARVRGIEEARFDLISFVDDDNSVAPDWVARVARTMAEHPEVGVLAGQNEAVCDGPAPQWLARVGNWYALTLATDPAGDLGDIQVASAGMTLRKSAWRELMEAGFEFRMMGRQGTRVAGMWDAELCLGLRLAGWRLWRDRELRLRHYLPSHRLKWSYLRGLVRAAGMCAPRLDPYSFALDSINGARKCPPRSRQRWFWTAIRLLRKIAGRPYTLVMSRVFAMEGNHRVIRLELHIGELLKVLQMRRAYDREVLRLRSGPLRQALEQLRYAKLEREADVAANRDRRSGL